MKPPKNRMLGEDDVRVLVADDNREIRSALRLALLEVADQAAPGAHGGSPDAGPCKVLEAGDTAETIALLEQAPVDLLLLDWELAGFDGARSLRQIKGLAPRCTVIAMSGRPEAREQSREAGADHFVGKNDPPAGLLHLLEGLYRQR